MRVLMGGALTRIKEDLRSAIHRLDRTHAGRHPRGASASIPGRRKNNREQPTTIRESGATFSPHDWSSPQRLALRALATDSNRLACAIGRPLSRKDSQE